MIQKPNQKTVISVGSRAVALVVGAKIGDGIVAVMPESTKPYKRWGVAAIALLGAACINTSTATGQGVQDALVGVGTKQLLDEATEALTAAIPVKVATDANKPLSITEKFVNALAGHTDAGALASPYYNLGAAWESANSYDYQSEQPQIQAQFTGL